MTYMPGEGEPPQPPTQFTPDHPKATLVLVLGILGIVVCGVIAPFAWVIGRNVLQEIDASNGTIGGRGVANAGYILGIVGTALLAIGVLVTAVVFGFLIIGAVNTGY